MPGITLGVVSTVAKGAEVLAFLEPSLWEGRKTCTMGSRGRIFSCKCQKGYRGQVLRARRASVGEVILELTSEEVELLIKRGGKNVPEKGDSSELEGSPKAMGSAGNTVPLEGAEWKQWKKSAGTSSAGGPCWPRYRGIVSLSR